MKTTTGLLALSLLAAACTRGENAGDGAGQGSTPSGGPTSSVVPVPIASATASAPVASATAAASASASAPPADAGAAKTTKDAGAGTPTAKLQPAKAHVDGKNFSLDVASPGCRAGEECTMTIKLVASADYHVNKEYPYKFVAAAAPGIMFLGKGDATTFSKASGDFVEEGEKTATMTVRFKPGAAGEAKVSGTYKMSVCSADQCQIEQQPVSLGVPVL